MHDFNDRVHGRRRILLLERRHQMAHPDPDAAVDVGMLLVSAGARAAVLADALRARCALIRSKSAMTN